MKELALPGMSFLKQFGFSRLLFRFTSSPFEGHFLEFGSVHPLNQRLAQLRVCAGQAPTLAPTMQLWSTTIFVQQKEAVEAGQKEAVEG